MTQTLIVIILSIIIYILYEKCKKIIQKTSELKDTDLNTPLEEFKESHKVSNHITDNGIPETNITALYEEMCIKHPLKYKDNKNIPVIIEAYKNILKGNIPDPEGKYVPAKYINDEINPDYLRYVTNQRKYNPALKEEYSRLVKEKNAEKLKCRLYATLVSKNIPPLIVNAAFQSENILNSFTSDDWIQFQKLVNEYIEISDKFIVLDFVESFDDKDILLNKEKFEQFVTLNKHHVPKDIMIKILKDKISFDVAIKALRFKYTTNCSLDEAIEEILYIENTKLKEEELRNKYHNLTK